MSRNKSLKPTDDCCFGDARDEGEGFPGDAYDVRDPGPCNAHHILDPGPSVTDPNQRIAEKLAWLPVAALLCPVITFVVTLVLFFATRLIAVIAFFYTSLYGNDSTIPAIVDSKVEIVPEAGHGHLG